MATNNNGNLLDSAGEVAIDAVWGNMPPQPNDVRTTRLDLTLGDHINLESGWGGFPQFTAGSTGSDVAGSTDYVQVPNVIGLTTALATDAMSDSGLTPTTATAATNAAGSITDIDRTEGSNVARITGTGFAAAYPAGAKITIASTGTVDGTWTVNNVESTDKVYFVSNATTALSSGTGSVIGVAGTIKTQSIAANAATTAVGAAVTITPYATAS
jgi:hypothetical protein